MYFAAYNSQNFANTWDVYAFSDKTDRDSYVEDNESRYTSTGNPIQCMKIRRDEIPRFVAAPVPFSGECRLINWDQPATGEAHEQCTGGRVTCGYSDECGYDTERLRK